MEMPPNQVKYEVPPVNSIRKLDDRIVNKIAAGEVVERPASVLKELVENSIDANAKKIEIEFHSGGVQKILVRDDGTGIRHGEIDLALSRHTTSKLGSFNDIEQIRTLGFRGEALPSIASVSRLKISTRTQEDQFGYQVECEGSKTLAEPTPVQHAVGTTIEISDLFFNVPARRKFLRTTYTERSYLVKLFKHMLLARTDIGFSLSIDGKKAKRFPIATTDEELSQRLKYVFSKEFDENCIRVEFERDSMKLTGWIGSPDYTRAQPDQQYRYVNLRAVEDRSISHAVRQAYTDLLFDGLRYPAFALFLEIAPTQVDVNVHPAKTKVRFKQPQDVYRCVLRAVSGALSGERPGTKQQSRFTHSLELGQNRPAAGMRQSNLSFDWRNDWTQLAKNQTESTPAAESQPQTGAVADSPPLGFALAQMGGAFILAENKEGLVIVDMHAAHERLTYERLKSHFDQSEKNAQNLLVPVTIVVSAEEAESAMANAKVLLELGFDISLSSETVIVVRAIPDMLKSTNIEQLIRDVIGDLMEQGDSKRVEHVRNQLLATMSCHSSIRANHSLTIPEMNSLLRQMEASEHSSYCSHGRPTWRQITMTELNRLFHRGR